MPNSSKRKYKKKKKEFFSLKQKISTLFCLLLLISAFTYGYYLGGENSNDLNKSKKEKILHKEHKAKPHKESHSHIHRIRVWMLGLVSRILFDFRQSVCLSA